MTFYNCIRYDLLILLILKSSHMAQRIYCLRDLKLISSCLLFLYMVPCELWNYSVMEVESASQWSLDGNDFTTTMLFCVVKNNLLKMKKNVNDSRKEIKLMLGTRTQMFCVPYLCNHVIKFKSLIN